MSTRKWAPASGALIVSVLALVVSGACGSSAADTTPTPGVEAVYTAAFGTFQAHRHRLPQPVSDSGAAIACCHATIRCSNNLRR